MEDIIKTAYRDLYKDKRTKKAKEIQSSERLKQLLQEINRLRDQLNETIVQRGNEIYFEELMKTSRDLDELVIRFLKEEKAPISFH